MPAPILTFQSQPGQSTFQPSLVSNHMAILLFGAPCVSREIQRNCFFWVGQQWMMFCHVFCMLLPSQGFANPLFFSWISLAKNWWLVLFCRSLQLGLFLEFHGKQIVDLKCFVWSVQQKNGNFNFFVLFQNLLFFSVFANFFQMMEPIEQFRCTVWTVQSPFENQEMLLSKKSEELPKKIHDPQNKCQLTQLVGKHSVLIHHLAWQRRSHSTSTAIFWSCHEMSNKHQATTTKCSSHCDIWKKMPSKSLCWQPCIKS